MDYYLDTEFLEGTQKKWFGQTKPTIDLISIGIVCEDGREFYAISKDFNLKEAWNRYDVKNRWVKKSPEFKYTENYKDYWIRENVLKPIWLELRAKEVEEYNMCKRINVALPFPTYNFTYDSLKRLINKYGKTNKQIAEDIEQFVLVNYSGVIPIKFFSYFGDYDWVVFCWLFGKMIDLPKGFPMYCNDLKQEIDRIASTKNYNCSAEDIQNRNDYPKQTNEHNAISDAQWNKELHKFLKTI